MDTKTVVAVMIAFVGGMAAREILLHMQTTKVGPVRVRYSLILRAYYAIYGPVLDWQEQRRAAAAARRFKVVGVINCQTTFIEDGSEDRTVDSFSFTFLENGLGQRQYTVTRLLTYGAKSHPFEAAAKQWAAGLRELTLGKNGQQWITVLKGTK